MLIRFIFNKHLKIIFPIYYYIFSFVIECSVCGGRQCAENAVCKNYQCVCKSGYYGNGYRQCNGKEVI